MKIIEECKIPVPFESTADSIPTTESSLTLFDYPWLMFPPLQPLFFFQLPSDTPSSYFTSEIVPRLKRSLSSVLQYYFPIAGKLVASVKNPAELTFVSNIDCADVSMTVAYSDADFDCLCSYLPRDNDTFHELVPSLPPLSRASPLLAVKVTYFSSSPGFSIGIAYHPVLCDQRCFNRFLHSWASFCKYGHLSEGLIAPTFDRSVIFDSNGLLPILSGQISGFRTKAIKKSVNGLLRATFVMSKIDIQHAKRWITSLCDKKSRPYPVLLSPYIVVCAFVWSSLLQTNVDRAEGTEGPMYFGFIAGGITRLKFRVPVNYFGNCVGFGRAEVKQEELLEEDGILAAADAIAMAIKELDTDLLAGAENWISELDLLLKGSEQHVNVVGSPKVDLYKTDFGWGRPEKIEEISIDVVKGISLTQSRDMNGGIEISLALTKSQMEAFCALFNLGLRCFSSESAI